MRSLLFVPGDSERKLEKSLSSGADAIVVDLEDSVPEVRKSTARGLAAEFATMCRARKPRPRIVVRINGPNSADWPADLAAVMRAPPDAVMLPKPRNGADVTRLADALSRCERDHGHTDGTTRILAIATERAASLLAMSSYIDASPRLEALAWGGEDLSAEIGARATVTDDGTLTSPFQLARDLCLLGATAAGVAAIDQVYVRLGDEAGLDREARAAARDGFDGKMAIHPDQIPIVNAAFTPTAEEVARARSLVAAFEAQGSTGGVFRHEGQMVDAPHLARARRLLARAR